MDWSLAVVSLILQVLRFFKVHAVMAEHQSENFSLAADWYWRDDVGLANTGYIVQQRKNDFAGSE